MFLVEKKLSSIFHLTLFRNRAETLGKTLWFYYFIYLFLHVGAQVSPSHIRWVVNWGAMWLWAPNLTHSYGQSCDFQPTLRPCDFRHLKYHGFIWKLWILLTSFKILQNNYILFQNWIFFSGCYTYNLIKIPLNEKICYEKSNNVILYINQSVL